MSTASTARARLLAVLKLTAARARRVNCLSSRARLSRRGRDRNLCPSTTADQPAQNPTTRWKMGRRTGAL
eukprot:2101367-Lingulodinium_polyedra.AAC.1